MKDELASPGSHSKHKLLLRLLRARLLRGPKRGLLRHTPNKILAQIVGGGGLGPGEAVMR